MNLLNKLTIKNLKLNKKRTVVTIIGIMLSVALITAVATMYSSAIESLIRYEKYQKGDFHAAFYNVDVKELPLIQNNRGVDKLYITGNIGYARLEGSKNDYKPYAFVKGFTRDSLEGLSVKMIEGRLPQNESEILISNHLKTNGRVDLKVGETITLEVGRRISGDRELNQSNPFSLDNNEEIVDTTPKTYTIVGRIERPASNIESYTAPGYTFITCLADDKINGTVDVYVRYNRFGSSNYEKVTSDILEVSEAAVARSTNARYESEEMYQQIMAELSRAKYEFSINDYLIMLENNPLDEDAMGGLAAAAVVVLIIIVITSVFCIKNSFDISITEKIKQYGMLRSIGATKKQIKRNVFFEGSILGLIGIPLGLLLGFLASAILIVVCNVFLKGLIAGNIKIVFGFSWIAVLIACILGVLTIYFSALRSANKASGVSPIVSIRNSADIKIKPKKLKTPFLIKKLFGIGGEISHKNYVRNKKKYRTTIISIIVSVSIFIGLSYFIGGVFREVDNEITRYDYNVSASVYLNSEDTGVTDKLLFTVKFDNIDDYAVKRYGFFYINNPRYNENYIKYGKHDNEEGLEYLNKYANLTVVALGDYQYKKYLKELNLDYAEYQEKAILYSGDELIATFDEDNNAVKMYSERYDYHVGDVLSIREESEETEQSITIGSITHKKPFGSNSAGTLLIVSDELYDRIVSDKYNMSVYYLSSNPNKLQDEIEEVMGDENFTLENIEENAKLMNNLYTLVAIFLYGFIIVISLIGITNIFNTITTNMNLRKQEFAMLKSVGMTGREFRKMIRLDSVLIGARSLLFGISIGTGISYVIYHVMEEAAGYKFKLPILSIGISIIVVYLLITVLMRYSMSKIEKENTIETIRNENI